MRVCTMYKITEALPMDKSRGLTSRQVTTLSDPKSGAWEKNFCLRILLYCIGNLHHPLACSSLPQGGRSFKIQWRGRDSLRELWDGLFCSFTNEYISEFEEDTEIWELLQEIKWKFPFKDFSD